MRCSRREALIGIVRVEMDGQHELSHAVFARNAFGAFLGTCEGRQQHSRQDSNDGDDHEELDECKSES